MKVDIVCLTYILVAFVLKRSALLCSPCCLLQVIMLFFYHSIFFCFLSFFHSWLTQMPLTQKSTSKGSQNMAFPLVCGRLEVNLMPK